MNNKKKDQCMKNKPQNIPKINFKNASEEKTKPGKEKNRTDKAKEMGPEKKIKLDSIDLCIERVIKEGLKITNEEKNPTTGKQEEELSPCRKINKLDYEDGFESLHNKQLKNSNKKRASTSKVLKPSDKMDTSGNIPVNESLQDKKKVKRKSSCASIREDSDKVSRVGHITDNSANDSVQFTNTSGNIPVNESLQDKKKGKRRSSCASIREDSAKVSRVGHITENSANDSVQFIHPPEKISINESVQNKGKRKGSSVLYNQTTGDKVSRVGLSTKNSANDSLQFRHNTKILSNDSVQNAYTSGNIPINESLQNKKKGKRSSCASIREDSDKVSRVVHIIENVANGSVQFTNTSGNIPINESLQDKKKGKRRSVSIREDSDKVSRVGHITDNSANDSVQFTNTSGNIPVNESLQDKKKAKRGSSCASIREDSDKVSRVGHITEDVANDSVQFTNTSGNIPINKNLQDKKKVKRKSSCVSIREDSNKVSKVGHITDNSANDSVQFTDTPEKILIKESVQNKGKRRGSSALYNQTTGDKVSRVGHSTKNSANDSLQFRHNKNLSNNCVQNACKTKKTSVTELTNRTKNTKNSPSKCRQTNNKSEEQNRIYDLLQPIGKDNYLLTSSTEELNDSLKIGNQSLSNNNKEIRSYEISSFRDKKLMSPCRVKVVPLTQENVNSWISKWPTYSNKNRKFEKNKNTMPRNSLKQNVRDKLSISSMDSESSSSDENESNETSSASSNSENNIEFPDNEGKTSIMVKKCDEISSDAESPQNEVKSKEVNSKAETSDVKEESEDDIISENCSEISEMSKSDEVETSENSSQLSDLSESDEVNSKTATSDKKDESDDNESLEKLSDMSKSDEVSSETGTSEKNDESDDNESLENDNQLSDMSESVPNGFRDENINFKTTGPNFGKYNNPSIENNELYKKQNSSYKIRSDEINLKTSLNGYTKFPDMFKKTNPPLKAVVQNNPVTKRFTFKKTVTGDLERNKNANTSAFFQQKNVALESNEKSHQETILKQVSTGDCIINEVEQSSSMDVNNDDDNDVDDGISLYYAGTLSGFFDTGLPTNTKHTNSPFIPASSQNSSQSQKLCFNEPRRYSDNKPTQKRIPITFKSNTPKETIKINDDSQHNKVSVNDYHKPKLSVINKHKTLAGDADTLVQNTVNERKLSTYKSESIHSNSSSYKIPEISVYSQSIHNEHREERSSLSSRSEAEDTNLKTVDKISPFIKSNEVITSELHSEKHVSCFRCGGNHSEKRCSHFHATCYKCGRKGHIQQVCQELLFRGYCHSYLKTSSCNRQQKCLLSHKIPSLSPIKPTFNELKSLHDFLYEITSPPVAFITFVTKYLSFHRKGTEILHLANCLKTKCTDHKEKYWYDIVVELSSCMNINRIAAICQLLEHLVVRTQTEHEVIDLMVKMIVLQFSKIGNLWPVIQCLLEIHGYILPTNLVEIFLNQTVLEKESRSFIEDVFVKLIQVNRVNMKEVIKNNASLVEKFYQVLLSFKLLHCASQLKGIQRSCEVRRRNNDIELSSLSDHSQHGHFDNGFMKVNPHLSITHDNLTQTPSGIAIKSESNVLQAENSVHFEPPKKIEQKFIPDIQNQFTDVYNRNSSGFDLRYKLETKRSKISRIRQTHSIPSLLNMNYTEETPANNIITNYNNPSSTVRINEQPIRRRCNDQGSSHTVTCEDSRPSSSYSVSHFMNEPTPLRTNFRDTPFPNSNVHPTQPNTSFNSFQDSQIQRILNEPKLPIQITHTFQDKRFQRSDSQTISARFERDSSVINRLLLEENWKEIVNIIINWTDYFAYSRQIGSTILAFLTSDVNIMIKRHNFFTNFACGSSISNPSIKQIISDIGINVILNAVGQDRWKDAYSAYDSIVGNQLDFTSAVVYSTELYSEAKKILLVVEICLHVKNFEKAVDLLNDHLMLLPSRDDWTVNSRETDVQTRNHLVSVLMDSIAKFKNENDMAFSFFSAIIEVQKCTNSPINVGGHYNPLLKTAFDKNYKYGLKFFNKVRRQCDYVSQINRPNFRAVIIGTCIESGHEVAKNMHEKGVFYRVYPKQTSNKSIYIKSYWTTEEMVVILLINIERLSKAWTYESPAQPKLSIKIEIEQQMDGVPDCVDVDCNLPEAKKRLSSAISVIEPPILTNIMSSDINETTIEIDPQSLANHLNFLNYHRNDE